MNGFSWAYMIGGLAFFFLGLRSARQGLQLAAGERLRLLIGKLTNNRFFAVGLGALVTVMLQSSSATTVILVSFAETQLMTLAQAFGVILGADIGTTLVVILISLKKITHYSLYLVALGIVMERLCRNQLVRYIGSAVLGFGMIFFGMYLMTYAAMPLRDNPIAIKVFEFLATNPFLNLVFAAIFTGIIQVSAATIGLAIALSYSGVLSFEAAIPIVLGANIGTCITACLSCLGVGTAGRRVAVAHVLIKIIGVLIVFPFVSDIAVWISKIDSYLASQAVMINLATSGKIVLTHLLFNIFITVLFLPLVRPGVWLVKKIVPRKFEEKAVFGPKYLDESALDTPALAFAQARREIMRIARIAHEMFENVLQLFHLNVDFDRLEEKTGSADDKIDLLEKAVRFYISKVSQKALTEAQAKAQVALLSIGSELEAVGDAISKEIIALAHKKRRKLARFSDEGYAELTKLHKLVLSNFDLMISMLTQPHKDIALKVLRHEKHLNEVEQDLRQSHLHRLHDKLPETYETSTIHMDLLGQFRMINSKLTHIVEVAQDLA
ncbi:MAG: Na/Pi cotransporter family protein [Pseudomonadota bacterium]